MARAPVPKEGKDPTDEFFANLSSVGHERLLHDAQGSLRVDVENGPRTEHFYVKIDKGHVEVSRKSARADAVVRISRDGFNQLVEGKMNTDAALLRGTLLAEGDLGLLTSFQRLFPGPPESQLSFLERKKGREA